MPRPLCVLFSSAFTLALSVHTPAPVADPQHTDFSGTYTLLPDKSWAVNHSLDRWAAGPDVTSERTGVGACGAQFVIRQTATQVTIRVVSGWSPTVADGTYELDHSTTVSSSGNSKRLGDLSWRGAALDLVLTSYRSETPAGRVELVFRFDRDGTLTVEYAPKSSAYDMLHNDSYRTITSVYQRSAP